MRYLNVIDVDFTIPPGTTPTIAAAYETYQRVCDELADAQNNAVVIDDTARAALSKAHLDSAAARVEGTSPPKLTPDKIQAKWEADIAESAASIAALWKAADDAGNLLANAIEADRAAYRASSAAAEDKTLTFLQHALADARGAIQELAHFRGAVDWIDNFNCRQAWEGKQPGFGGKDVVIDADARGLINFGSSANALAVLDVLDKAAVRTAPTTTRVLVEAAESSYGKGQS